MALVQKTTDIEQLQAQRIGYAAVSLTEYDTDSEPEIAEGSVLEIGGALYEAQAAESASGWAGIANSSDVYIKINATTLLAEFTTTAPTWSTSKQGWYDSLDRYVAKLYKDGAGAYTLKRILYPRSVAAIRAAEELGADVVETNSILDDAVITSKIIDLAVTGAKLAKTFAAEQTQAVGASATWTIPAGWYWLYGAGTVLIQSYWGASTWVSSGTGPLFACCDGSNMRASNAGGTAQTLFYKKLA